VAYFGGRRGKNKQGKTPKARSAVNNKKNWERGRWGERRGSDDGTQLEIYNERKEHNPRKNEAWRIKNKKAATSRNKPVPKKRIPWEE